MTVMMTIKTYPNVAWSSLQLGASQNIVQEVKGRGMEDRRWLHPSLIKT